MQAQMMFDAYLADLQSRRVSDTALREYRIVTTRFLDYLKANDMDAADVRRAHVQAFFTGSGWGPSTQHSRLTWLRSPYLYAIEELGLFDRNPCQRVRLQPVPRRDVVTIPNDHLRRCKAACRDQSDAAVFAMFAYTGMRRAEVRGLRWDGVSFGNASLNFIGKGGHERTIPMHPEVAKALKALGMWAGASPWVFQGRQAQLTSSGMDRRVTRIVGPDYSAHDFRHTVASSLEHNGAREAAIFAILGWSPDSSLRLRHYTAMPMEVLYREMLKLYADDPV